MDRKVRIGLSTVTGLLGRGLVTVATPAVLPISNSTSIATGLLLFPLCWLAMVWLAIVAERGITVWCVQGASAVVSVAVVLDRLSGGLL